MDPLAAIFACENFTSIKRIEKEFFVSIVILDDEVAGHAHARDWEFQPARDFHVNRGERDWNSDAPVEDVVKEAVPRIVIIFGISTKPDSLKQDGIDLRNGLHR